MTLAELIETLVDQAREINPEWEPGDPLENDPEIVVAYQPNWPMETQITNVVLIDPMADWEDEFGPEPAEDDPDHEAWAADRALTEDKPKSIVIGTAWGNEYLRSGGATALGWR